MSLRMEEAQRHTDKERGLADQREALHRFAPIEDFGGGPLHRANPEKEGSDHAKASQSARPLHFLDYWWDAHLLKREQIERDEKKAFNLKYNYAP